MSSRNDQSVSELAQSIRRRLEQAPAAARAATPEQVARGEDQLRVTKSGELIAPGEEVPKGPDGAPVPHTAVPSGTFHRGRQ